MYMTIINIPFSSYRPAKLINLFTGNILNSVVHRILEKAIDRGLEL